MRKERIFLLELPLRTDDSKKPRVLLYGVISKIRAVVPLPALLKTVLMRVKSSALSDGLILMSSPVHGFNPPART